mmetsp:Transcript_6911/g.17282  ORF Transcript_6911/g.17282 Transcript_6911/m.17282 type:complete len:85 (-) Transcript_6911:424-678(-)
MCGLFIDLSGCQHICVSQFNRQVALLNLHTQKNCRFLRTYENEDNAAVEFGPSSAKLGVWRAWSSVIVRTQRSAISSLPSESVR